MMRLDRLCRLRSALDHIRIQRSLCQPLDILADDQFLDLFIKRIDKLIADDLALLLRIAHPGQLA